MPENTVTNGPHSGGGTASGQKIRIVVADDHPIFRDGLCKLLALEEDFEVVAQAQDGHVVFCQLIPWQFDYAKQYNLKRTYRRSSFLVTRLLANLGVAGATPVLARFHDPVTSAKSESRWMDGMYLDKPEEWDDPYRFFRW